MPVINNIALANNRIDAIRAYHEATGMERAELDVSGGIDSAVMLMLLVDALGADKVTAVYSSINSSEESRDRARMVAKAAGVRLCEVEATAAYDLLVEAAVSSLCDTKAERAELEARMANDPLIKGSLRSCLRAPLGRFMNRLAGNGIRHGTGNECEDRWLRFYQKGGDGEVDTNPLAMLSKGEVYQLAVGLGVPKEIITCKPTPDLQGVGEEHNDEDELTAISGVPWTYSRVDPETAEYISVGTIERMSRWMDGTRMPLHLHEVAKEMHLPVETREDVLKRWGTVPEIGRQKIFSAAKEFGLTPEHVESAHKWERITRHKENPNCPTLGTRQELLDTGIIENELPKL